MSYEIVKPPSNGWYNHAYAIIGYAPRTDLVSVWNPWGQNFTPHTLNLKEVGLA